MNKTITLAQKLTTGRYSSETVLEAGVELYRLASHILNQNIELDQLIPMAEKLEQQADRDTALLRQGLEALENEKRPREKPQRDAAIAALRERLK